MPPQYPGHGYPPQPGAYYDPAAPYGRHAITGEPLSDKSKVIAGLLQLIGLLGLLGFGRMYLGQVGLGIAQLLVGLACIFVISWLTCGLSLLLIVGNELHVAIANGESRRDMDRVKRSHVVCPRLIARRRISSSIGIK